MDLNEKNGNGNANGEDWQALCARVAQETDPRRLCTLIEQLIKALDAHNRQLRQKALRGKELQEKELQQNEQQQTATDNSLRSDT